MNTSCWPSTQGPLRIRFKLAGVPLPATQVVPTEKFRLHGPTDLDLRMLFSAVARLVMADLAAPMMMNVGSWRDTLPDVIMPPTQAATDLISATPAFQPARWISVRSHGIEASWTA